MEGTRQSLLKQIVDWVTSTSGGPQHNTYWFYGSPGIGKSSLAHSICAKLHDQKRLAGAFFCRRDDEKLSVLRNIFPNLINKLAGIFSPFRSVVANHLRNDPNLTPESMRDTVFLDFIRALPRHPKHSLVFVIDALDECGDAKGRPGLLKVLTEAAALAPWLKVIITSRPEVDIERFFDTLHIQSSHLRYDLARDEEAPSDLETFARSRLGAVALARHLQPLWPAESLFNEVLSQAAGLFIFVETLALSLERSSDPTELLKAALQGSADTGLKPLYSLYTSIVNRRRGDSKINDKFRLMIGVLLATAPYRPLCDKTIATLAGVELSLVQTWVDDLSSLLYRDEGANRGIRVRHLSISDFFSNHCDVSLEDANVRLGIASLETMTNQLSFNICQLEDSRVANADIKDLPFRIKENISDALQYSSLYWSNHVCCTSDNGNERVWGCLREFFEGLYPLFWVEVLSIMGVVPIGAPSLRRLVCWLQVITTPVFHHNIILTCCRTAIRPSLTEFKTLFVSSSPSTRLSLSALHTFISRHDPSCPHNHYHLPSSLRGLLKPSRCKPGSCRHGQHHHWNGLDTIVLSTA